MDFVVVATADWDNPLWTNKQHLACRWGRAGHRVLYVESLGLRRPQVSRRDAGRIWRRLRRANRLRRGSEGVWVLSPLVLPFHDRSWARGLNRGWLAALVRGGLRKLELKDPVLWTYNPVILEYLGDLRWRRVVYHCVDELVGAPGIPDELVERQERRLLAEADLVVVSAPTLAEAKRPLARRLAYLPNPADFQHFRRAASPETAVAPELVPIARPRIGFIGAVSDYKLDLDGLAKRFEEHGDWQLVLVGPVGEGDPGTAVDRLKSVSNVHLLGTRPFDALPSFIKGFDVCLLPNRLNRYTVHMFPLKFFEYLASGKPVVMSPLPGLRDYWHLGYVASPGDEEAFEGAIREALAEPEDAPIREERVQEAARHDWAAQAERVLALVTALNGG